MRALTVLFALFLLVAPEVIAGQESGATFVRGRSGQISGIVLDGSSGEALPGATVQIDGTYRGTVTNSAGRFQLLAPSFPADLVVRFIGYRTRTVSVPDADRSLRIEMTPVPFEMEEVVITGEDPAIRIMRRVIENKKVWRSGLDTYRADAYNRFSVENDTGIVSIWESQTVAFWDRERGVREISVWQQQTRNMDVDGLLPAAMLVQNLYDDDIEIAGHRLMGVTHPRALSYYDFRLEGIRAIDDQDVFDISVRPKSRTGSGFVGRVAVVDSLFALLEVDLEPSQSFLFPPPIERFDIAFEQQFSRFAGDIWFPVDYRSRMDLELSFGFLLKFPTFTIRQLSRLSDYEVNVAVPDSLYESDDVVVIDSTQARRVQAAPPEALRVPLTDREQLAYRSIDSTMTIERAFQPRGLLARFIDATDTSSGEGGGGGAPDTTGTAPLTKRFGDSGVSIRPDVRITRVEGLRAGARVTVPLSRWMRVSGSASFLTARDEVNGAVGGSIGRSTRLFAEWETGIRPRYRSHTKGLLLNSVPVFIGNTDYFDYYESRGWEVGLSHRFSGRRDIDMRFTFTDQRHRSVEQALEEILFGIQADQFPNVSISEGSFRSISVEGTWRGRDNIPLGIGPERAAIVRLERSVGGSALTEEGFTQAEISITSRFNTFFQRRFLPNALDIRLNAGISDGDVPVQRLGIVDGSSSLKTFGVLRTRPDRPYQGDRWLHLAWEHSFRTVPFELIGWQYPMEQFWNVILTGGHGMASLDRTMIETGDTMSEFIGIESSDGWHHEIGLSLSGLFQIMRVDLAWRLDQPGFFVGLGIARIF